MTSRTRSLRLFSLVIVAASFSAPAAHGQAPKQKPEESNRPLVKVLMTADNWQIPITYYPATGGQDAPAVVLLHGRRGDRLVWDRSFAKRLQADGYAVVSVDLRKHGKSQNTVGDTEGTGSKLKPGDYQAMVTEDLRVVKGFLFDEHQKRHLNIRKTGFVAAEMSVPLALTFAANDWLEPPYDDANFDEDRTPRGQDIRAIVMISPEAKLPGVATARVIEQVRDPDWEIAFLTIYGTNDTLDKGESKQLYNKLSLPAANRNRVYIKPYAVGLRGTALLDADDDVQKQILGFLKIHLKELPDEWRDRQSPLTK